MRGVVRVIQRRDLSTDSVMTRRYQSKSAWQILKNETHVCSYSTSGTYMSFSYVQIKRQF